MFYYSYILYSKSLNRFYFGSCKAVDVRLLKHLSNHKGFTGKAKDWRLCLAEEFETKSEAARRERQLKRWKSRERTWQFIERCHKELYEMCGSTMESMDEYPYLNW
jgi:putative endonuclease